MEKTITISDSLIGSLCREVEQIRLRNKHINYSLITCRNNDIRKRLLNEIKNLNRRRKELKDISKSFLNDSKLSISKMLFIELCSRPIELTL